MAKRVIEIPDDCRECLCFMKASTGVEGGDIYLCQVFSRILEVEVNDHGNVEKVNRCTECGAADISEPLKEVDK